jgi:hypothetical protein
MVGLIGENMKMNPWKRYKHKVNLKRFQLRRYRIKMKQLNKIRKKYRKNLDKQILMSLPSQEVTDENNNLVAPNVSGVRVCQTKSDNIK